MAQALQAAQLQSVLAGDRQYPKPSDFHPSYGTAGFRAVADRLPSTVYRYLSRLQLPALFTVLSNAKTV